MLEATNGAHAEIEAYKRERDGGIKLRDSFPLEVFPEWLQSYAKEVAAACELPVSVIGFGIMGMLSCSYGMHLQIGIENRYVPYCKDIEDVPIPACRAQRLRLIRGGGSWESKATHALSAAAATLPTSFATSPKGGLSENALKTVGRKTARILMTPCRHGASRRGYERGDCPIVRASRVGAWGASPRRPRAPSDLPPGARPT